MKRLLTIALNLCLIFAFMGCAPAAPAVPAANTAAPAAPAATVAPEAADTAAPAATAVPAVADTAAPAAVKVSGEVTFATWGSLDEKATNEAIIAQFEKDYPGTKVNLEYIPDSYVQKIDTEFMGGTAPDVIYGHPHYLAKWASEGLLMNLDPYFDKDHAFFYNEDNFTTSLYDAFKWNGQHIGTINGSDTFLLFYNKDLFDKAGVAYPTDEWTWDDFVAAGQKLTDPATHQYGFSVNSWPVMSEPFVASFGGSIFDDMNHPTKVTYDSPQTVAGLQFYQDLVYKYKISPSVQDSQTLGSSFDTGKVAMDVNGMYQVVSRKNITDFKWDVANLPMVKGMPRKTIAFFAGYGINKSTKNPDLAWEFAKYMQSDAAQKILAGYGLITVINHKIMGSPEITNAPGMPPHDVLRVTSVDYANNGFGFLTNWDEMVAKAIQPSYDQLLANTMDPATTAKTIQAALETLLAQSAKQQ
jgi:multiple sugar transport system substrate-binding protein